MLKKSITAIALVMCLGLFAACGDYGYEFHFSVVGENGSISTEWDRSSPVLLLGGKNGQQLEFTAQPDKGYQVKEWTFNGETVENNKTNSFTAIVTSYKQEKNTMCLFT